MGVIQRLLHSYRHISTFFLLGVVAVVRCITAFRNGRSHIAVRVSAPGLLLQALFLESRHLGSPWEW
jgi:hypothetical protein